MSSLSSSDSGGVELKPERELGVSRRLVLQGGVVVAGVGVVPLKAAPRELPLREADWYRPHHLAG